MIRLAALVAFLASCGGAGLSADVRTDISARWPPAQRRMARGKPDGFKGNRKLKGTMVLTFAAGPGTGAFSEITVARDDVGDPKLQACVIGEVGKLKLEKPQSTKVAVSGYPLNFAPSN